MTTSKTDLSRRSHLGEAERATCESDATVSGTVTRLDSFQRRAALMSGCDPKLFGDDFVELGLDFEADQGALWCTFNHRERPCFTPRLLAEIDQLQRGLRQLIDHAQPPLRTLVWASDVPTVWNLGGDLTLFVELIRVGAREALRRYAHSCVETVYQNLTKFDLPLVTVALVQGDALGGGFEAVLTNDVIIAEEGSKFGLPEILFNMFPGMGAYSLLSRGLDGCRAERMILSGRLYEANEMEAMGLVDVVVPAGTGPAAVREYLARNNRRHRVLQALGRVRRRCHPVAREELLDVTDLWVETALGLDPADLRRMERLADAQQRRHARLRATADDRERINAVG